MRFSIPPNPPDDETWVRAEDTELPCPLLLRLGLRDDGRLVATGLLIEANDELHSADLRLPLAKIVGDFAAAASKPATFRRLYGELLWTKFHTVVNWADPEPTTIRIPDPWRALLPVPTRTSPIARVRPGRRGHPPEHYQKFAAAYRRAQRTHSDGPIKALMKEFHVEEATVHRWLRTARERGLLPEKTPSKKET